KRKRPAMDRATSVTTAEAAFQRERRNPALVAFVVPSDPMTPGGLAWTHSLPGRPRAHEELPCGDYPEPPPAPRPRKTRTFGCYEVVERVSNCRNVAARSQGKSP